MFLKASKIPYIAPMIVLERQYLYETNRTTTPGDIVVLELSPQIGLRVCEKAISNDVTRCLPGLAPRSFRQGDRGHAALHQTTLVTKDSTIRTHYPHALW